MSGLVRMVQVVIGALGLVALAVVAGAGLALATGQLDGDRVWSAMRALRGDPVISPELYASLGDKLKEEQDFERANWDLVEARRSLGQEREEFRLERQEWLAKKGEFSAGVEALRKQVDAERQLFAEERAAFEAQREADRNIETDQSFTETVALISKVEAEVVAKIISELPDVDVARYLRALSERKAAEVLTAFALAEQAAAEAAPAGPGGVPGGRLGRILRLLEQPVQGTPGP